MTDQWKGLLFMRNELSDALRELPNVTAKMYKPPIIDASVESSDGDEDLGVSDIPGLKQFETSIEKEIDVLDKALNEQSVPTHLSSNAPYYLSVWREIQAAKSLVSIGTMFEVDYPNEPHANTPRRSGKEPHQKSFTVKVDVVADEGMSWTRVNTMKNSRLRSEFTEMDAYSDAGSEGDGSEVDSSSPCSSDWRNNSLLRAASTLVSAAKVNPVAGTGRIPSISMRLTRLFPDDKEPRIEQTIEEVRRLGVAISLGEMARPDGADAPATPLTLEPIPSTPINLDLSLLVALVSDITHAPLAPTQEESLSRYRPLVRRWKKAQNDAREKVDADPGLAVHSRALGVQAEQERRFALFKELHDRLRQTYPEAKSFEFYASSEARDRLRGILSKIGGQRERIRADALFDEDEDATNRFWDGSRFPVEYISGLIPLKIHEVDPERDNGLPLSPFFQHLSTTCKNLLKDMEKEPESDVGHVPIKAMKKADQTRSPALTPHTVRSLLLGAGRGMTTVTANKASVRAILREMRKQSLKAEIEEPDVDTELSGALRNVALESSTSSPVAALWVVEPRSLAENMRSDVGEA